MELEDLIAANEFCTLYKVEYSFIDSLHRSGLVELTLLEGTPYLHNNQLVILEKIIFLHYELEINIEGIEAITHLLQQVATLQDEVNGLQNRLRLYEGAGE